MCAHVLIAEDHPMQAQLVRRYLEHDGHTTILARDGWAAVDAARRHHPDLIVLDVMMPGLDGLGALRQLKENPATKDIPVVVLSSKGHALTRIEAEQAGAAMFLTKPFSPNQLLSDVKKILETPAA